jgi:hypothetical protein
LSSDVYRWKINDRFTNGVPDAWYCGDAGHLFVEYKYVELPSRPHTLVKANLSKNQLQWLLDRHAQNVPVAVVVGSPDGAYWAENIQNIYSGIPLTQFLDFCLTPKEIALRIQYHVTQNTTD